MFTFEEFQKINRSHWDEREMQRNYAIALQVEQTYYDRFGNAKQPKIGDIVEYTDGWRIYTGASIVENLYGSEPEICICDKGHSFTSGRGFSTSGGAFHSMDASLLQYVGEAINYVWTWGCNGIGANQDINIPLKVNKWIIPYDAKKVKRSTVNFKRNDQADCDAIWIENSDDCWIHAHSFKSKKAFEAWAKYVGYEFHMDGEKAYSAQKIVKRCWVDPDKKPENGKPLKVIANGRVHDGLVVTEETCITEWWYNGSNEPYHTYNTPEGQKEIELFWKYDGNPMGV